MGALESSSEEGSSLDEPSWVSWFCMLRNHEFFCEVDPAFVQDRFNLYGLKEIVGPLTDRETAVRPDAAHPQGTGDRAHPLRAYPRSICSHSTGADRYESQVQGSRVRVVPAHALREADSTSDGGV